MNTQFVLRGIDGTNPLGFLAAIGVLALLADHDSSARLTWQSVGGRWHPGVADTPFDVAPDADPETALARELHRRLNATDSSVFEVDRKLPFAAAMLEAALRKRSAMVGMTDRRIADLLAAYGSDVVVNDKGVFEATSFCMVRSGDSAGNGLPAYALKLRESCGEQELSRTLFCPWDYQDDGPSLRLDPTEDRRYALGWHNPTDQSKQAEKKPLMIGANVLALEALALLPSVACGTGLQTTGFASFSNRSSAFTWPIWDGPLTCDEVRSLVALAELRQERPDRQLLRRRGIREIFRANRVAPNQYYRNFTPAQPV
jgi:hypothetical protein